MSESIQEAKEHQCTMSESLQGDELASKVGSSPGWGKKGKWSKRGANLMGQRLRGIIRACT